ncbi:MAG: LysM peptidoglycan-binding domain-containing protein [Mesorhizobium sp.]|nr:LysM peptidoglycan-binding domain-containing protein [Mesorhizobium sp.]
MSDLVGMRLFLPLPFVGVFALLLLPAPAHACQGGRTVVSGETVAEVAARCGVNAEALRQLNPGLNDRTIRSGLVLNVPARPLPTPQLGVGRSQVTVQPPAAASPGVTVRVPRPETYTPPAQTIERPLIGHMQSILEPF